MNESRVLLVDDKINPRRTIKSSLLGLNCVFSEAKSGEEALEFIEQNAFDVIFLDLKLPGISGIETYRRAKLIRKDLCPVIILTGYPEITTAVQAGKLGAFHYLTKKPIDRDQVRDTFIKAATWKSELNNSVISRCFKFSIMGCYYRIPAKDDLVFVGMPFSTELEDIYKYGIKPTVEDFGLKCWRADEYKELGDITCKVCGSLQSCRLVIMDISGLNPNVCIELGLAYGFGKKVILLKNDKTEMPANLAGIEHVEYKTIDSLKTALKQYLAANLE